GVDAGAARSDSACGRDAGSAAKRRGRARRADGFGGVPTFARDPPARPRDARPESRAGAPILRARTPSPRPRAPGRECGVSPPARRARWRGVRRAPALALLDARRAGALL